MMNYEFRVKGHDFLPGKMMVEVWRDGVFVAGIYPHEDGIRIVSKYMSEVKKDAEVADGKGGWIPAMSIKLEQKPVGHSNHNVR